MPRLRRICFIVLASIVLAASVVYFCRTAEPSYQGKSLSQWTALFDSGLERDELAATAALREIGEPAVPFLLAMLKSTDPPFHDFIERWFSKQSLINIKFTPADAVRLRASRALQALGSVARGAVRTLMQMLYESNGEADVGRILAAIHPAGVPPLINACTNGSSQMIQSQAIRALGWMGPEAKAAVPMLLHLVQQTNIVTRGPAIRALGDIGESSDELLREVTNLFHSEGTQLDAAYALSCFGEKAALSLTLALTNQDRKVCAGSVAALTLRRLEKARPFWLHPMNRVNDRQRRSSIFNLKVMSAAFVVDAGKMAPEMKAILVEQQESSDPELRSASAEVLAALAEELKP